MNILPLLFLLAPCRTWISNGSFLHWWIASCAFWELPVRRDSPPDASHHRSRSVSWDNDFISVKNSCFFLSPLASISTDSNDSNKLRCELVTRRSSIFCRSLSMVVIVAYVVAEHVFRVSLYILGVQWCHVNSSCWFFTCSASSLSRSTAISCSDRLRRARAPLRLAPVCRANLFALLTKEKRPFARSRTKKGARGKKQIVQSVWAWVPRTTGSGNILFFLW